MTAIPVVPIPPVRPTVDGLPQVPGRAVLLTAFCATLGAVALAVGAAVAEQWLTGSARVGTMLVAGLTGMTLPVLIAGRLLRWTWADWGFRRPRQSLWHLLWQVPLAILSSLTLTGLVLTGLDAAPAEQGAAEAAFGEGSLVVVVLVGIAAIVVAPLIEEMFFRRMLLDWLRRHTPVTIAVLVTAACFALVHVLPPAMLYVGLVGLWMTGLRVWSGALWHPVILHAANNALATVIVLTALS